MNKRTERLLDYVAVVVPAMAFTWLALEYFGG